MIEETNDKHTKFYYLGWVGIISGIAVVIVDIILYTINSCHKFDFGPPTTAAFTIAGLFFVLDNLKLQRFAIYQQNVAINLQKKEIENQVDELRITNAHFDAQNKSLINQQYQTTFFSLLNGHTTLMNSLNFYQFMGFEGWSNFFRDMKNEITEYNQMIHNKYFPDYKKLGKNPFFSLHHNKHLIESTLGDIITIIKLVDDKLPEKLYYDILYNYLTVYEKLFIGLYCDCYEDVYTKFIIGHKDYDFLKYYKEQPARYHLSKQTYFPTIKIKRESNLRELQLKELKDSDKFFSFHLWVEHDLYESTLELEKIGIDISIKDIYTQAITPKSAETIDAHGVIVGNWPYSNHYQFSQFIVGKLSELPLGWYNILFNFFFKYQSISYIVCYKMETNIFLDNSILGESKRFHVNYEEI